MSKKKLSYCIVVMVLYWFQENYKQWHCVVFGTILKNRKKQTTQYNIITQYNLVKFKGFLQKLYFVIELYCIVLFLEQIKKKRKKPTTQYNTITQYNLVKFKGFLRKLLLCCIVFIVLFSSSRLNSLPESCVHDLLRNLIW